MSMARKIDHETLIELKTIFSKFDVTNRKVTVDLQNETIEVEDDCSVDDILESAGILTTEEARQLEDSVRQMRESDWD